jgi:hypothetical protein
MFILSLDFINHVIKFLNVIMATGFTKMQVCAKDYLNCNMEKKEDDNSFYLPVLQNIKMRKMLKSLQYA